MSLLLRPGLHLFVERIGRAGTGAVTWAASFTLAGHFERADGFAKSSDAWTWLNSKLVQ